MRPDSGRRPADGDPAIADYGVIGDCRTAALVARDGSIDWWCLPRFDGPATLVGLLDRERGGSFAVRPAAAEGVERRYLPDTNVLETVFVTDGGRLRVTDFMPVLSEDEKHKALRPEREILRYVECLSGEVEVEVSCDPRPEYGRRAPRCHDRGALGLFWSNGREALALRSEIPLGSVDLTGRSAGTDDCCARGRETLRAGERRWVSLSYTDGDPAVLAVFGQVAERMLESTVEWWRAWSAQCGYRGPYREAVVRSALAVKLLVYAPSGAVIAAPTTSLPEVIGGVRNWDYRYCWLRDASLTVQALMDLGYAAEGTAYLSWILHSTRLGGPDLRVLYDVHGRRAQPERALEHLEGYAGSRPVRIGNAAQDQLQLDVYGEVADAVVEHVRRGGGIDGATRRLLVRLGKRVVERWREPDESIWETRLGRRHHTYSRVMCWVALDRLLELHEGGEIDCPAARFRAERDAIRAEVESRGWSERLQSYVAVLDSDEVDASLLLLPRYRYADPRHPRMQATCARVHERLAVGPLLYRYLGQDGLPGEEGAFGIASFWGVECRARQGDLEGARATFEQLLGYANDLGLLAEEIDPATGALLGNFPQGFTHVGMIDAALTLAELTAQAPPRGRTERKGAGRR